MIFLYKYWFCIYLRTRANTRTQFVSVTICALFRPQKTYFLLSEGSKSLIIMFFLFPELNSIKNITMLKKLPDHFKITRRLIKERDLFWVNIKTVLFVIICNGAENWVILSTQILIRPASFFIIHQVIHCILYPWRLSRPM